MQKRKIVVSQLVQWAADDLAGITGRPPDLEAVG